MFNIEKLNWINRQYIKKFPSEKITREIETRIPESLKASAGYNKEVVARLAPTLMERISVFGEVSHLADAGELDYYFLPPAYEPERLLWKDETSTERTRRHAEAIIGFLETIPAREFDAETVKAAVWGYAEAEGKGNVLWPMRYALSGRNKSPDPFELAYILGKEETLRRLDRAARNIAAAAA